MQRTADDTNLAHEAVAPGPAPTILIVDDDPVVRSLMQDSLEDEGFSVIEAEDGVQACGACDRTVPSLLIVDAIMPNMDGFELCRRLRAGRTTQYVPILMATGLDDRLDRQGLQIERHRLHRQAAQLAHPRPPHPLYAARRPHPRGSAPEPAAASRRAGARARAKRAIRGGTREHVARALHVRC